MLQLITSLKINTGLTKRARRGYSQREPQPIFLTVSGTPKQLSQFLTEAVKIPDHLGVRASFASGDHYTGVVIASKVSFPVTQEFTAEVNKVLTQLRGAF